MHIQTSDQPSLHLGVGDYTCNWGIHIAGLYETEAERDEILFGYLDQGATSGDFQFFCLSEQTVEEFQARYRACCPASAHLVDDPTVFDVRPARDLYFPTGLFSPWDMDEGLAAFYEESQASGPRNIRAGGDMAWALETVPGAEHLMAYESRLNYFIPNKPWVSICLYDVSRISGAMLMDVLRTHPYTLSGGVITENPYFQDPDDWLEAHAPAFLKP